MYDPPNTCYQHVGLPRYMLLARMVPQIHVINVYDPPKYMLLTCMTPQMHAVNM